MWSADVERSLDRRWTARLWVDETGGRGVGLHVRGAWVIFDALTATEIARVPYAYGGDDSVVQLTLDENEGALVVRTHEHPPWGGRRVVAEERIALPAPSALAPMTTPHLVLTAAREDFVVAIDALRGRRGGEPSHVRATARDRIAVSLAGAEDVLARLALDEPARLTLDDIAIGIDEVNAMAGPGRLQVRLARVPAPTSEEVRVRFAGRDALLAPSAMRPWIDVPIDDASRALLERVARYPLPASLARLTP